MTEIAKLTAKLEADTRQFDQAMQGSNKQMTEARNLVGKWADSYKEAADDIDDYVSKLEKRIEELEKQNSKSTSKMEDDNDKLKDNIKKNAEYIEDKYNDVTKATRLSERKISDFSKTLKWSLFFASAGVASMTSLAVIKQQAFDLNRELDETIKLMRQLAGSGGEQVAKQIFETRGPVGRGALTSGAYQMLSAGKTPQDVKRQLDLLSDATTGLGGDDEMFNQLATGMTLLGTRGAELEGYSTLANMGVNVDEYVKPLGAGSTTEALDRIARGAVETERLVKEVTKGLNEDFAGLVDSQEQTYEGWMRSIGQFFEQTAMKFGKTWYENIKEAAKNMSEILWSEENVERADRMIEAVNKGLEQIAIRATKVSDAVAPAIISLTEVATKTVEVGAELLKATEPSFEAITSTASIAASGFSKVMGVVGGVINQMKGLGEVIGLIFTARLLHKLLAFIMNMQLLKDLTKFLRTQFGKISPKFEESMKNMTTEAKKFNQQMKTSIPQGLRGFAEGAKAAFTGIRDGAKAAWEGTTKGFKAATSNMHKGFKQFVGSLFGLTRESVKFTGSAAKAAASGLNIMTTSFKTSSKEMIGSFKNLAKAAASFTGSLLKGFTWLGKQLLRLYTPMLLVVAAMKSYFEVANNNAEINRRAEESTKSFTAAIRDNIKAVKEQAAAHAQGTANVPEPVGRRERMENLLFESEEQRANAYADFQRVTGRQAQSPLSFITENYAYQSDIVAQSLNNMDLEARNVNPSLVNQLLGGSNFTSTGDPNENLVTLLQMSTGRMPKPKGIGGWVGQLAMSFAKTYTDERALMKSITGGTDEQIDQLIESYISGMDLKELQTNMHKNILKSVDELIEEANNVTGLDWNQMERDLDFGRGQGRVSYHSQYRALQEHLSTGTGEDAFKKLIEILEYLDNVEIKSAINLESTTRAFRDADRALGGFDHTVDFVGDSMMDLGRAAYSASAAIEDQAAAIYAMIRATSNLIPIATAMDFVNQLESTGGDIISNTMQGGMSVMRQAPTIENYLNNSIGGMLPGIRESHEELYPNIPFNEQRNRAILGTFAVQALDKVLSISIPQSQRDIVWKELGYDDDLKEQLKFTPQEARVLEDAGMGYAINEMENVISVLTRDFQNLGVSVSSVDSSFQSLYRTSEHDGHMILAEGQVWDKNLIDAAVLRDGDVRDVRLIESIPSVLQGGGGGGGGTSVTITPGVDVPYEIPSILDVQPEPADYTITDEHRAAAEAATRTYEAPELYQESTHRWGMIDRASMENIEQWKAFRDLREAAEIIKDVFTRYGVPSDIFATGTDTMDALMRGDYPEELDVLANSLYGANTQDMQRDAWEGVTPSDMKLIIEIYGDDGNPLNVKDVHTSGGDEVFGVVDVRSKHGRLVNPADSGYSSGYNVWQTPGVL